jgi:SAM-dependent methyltransferase
MNQHAPSPGAPHRARHLDDPRRLQTQLSEEDLARLLALRGDEDVIDLGSGTGFYTERIAALTRGLVYAVEIEPDLHHYHASRGPRPNVRLVLGDVTRLDLPPGSAEVAVSIATWHETGGVLDLPGLARILRPGGRLIVIDWRRDPESFEGGPPLEIRADKDEVAAALAPWFTPLVSENLGRNMFVVVGRRSEEAAQPDGTD